MVQGKIFNLEWIRVVAVYDNTTICDRCDLFEEDYCPLEFYENNLDGIDCAKEKIVFKKIGD